MRRINWLGMAAAVAVLYFSVTSAAVAKDPAAYGSYGHTNGSYNGISFTYPETMPSGSMPLVILIHGLYETERYGSRFLESRSAGGYSYFTKKLASHGYVVSSISVNLNTLNSAALMSQAVLDRLAKFRALNRSGVLSNGTSMVGKINMNNVGLFGHSRGGAAIQNAFIQNQTLSQPYGIKALFSIAPSVSENHPFSSEDVALATLLPYCDGDVTSFTGINKFEDHRYTDNHGVYGKHTIVAMGASHNGYNTYWTRDDGLCGGASNQRADATAYINAFFRTYLGNERDLLPVLTGEQSVSNNETHIGYQPPANPDSRRVINGLNESYNVTINTAGGAVSSSDVRLTICGRVGRCANGAGIQYNPYFSSNRLNLSWTRSGAWYQNEVPAGARNVSAYDTLQFRAGSSRGNSTTQDFDVQLIDTRGNVASVPISSVSDALFSPNGNVANVIPRVVLSSVRIPLSRFSGVDLNNIASIKMVFNKATTGDIILADLMFSASPAGIAIPQPESVPQPTSTPTPIAEPQPAPTPQAEPATELVCFMLYSSRVCQNRPVSTPKAEPVVLTPEPIASTPKPVKKPDCYEYVGGAIICR